jgi:type II secretory pathway pseudopilin PulG
MTETTRTRQVASKKELARAMWGIPTPFGASLLALIIVGTFVAISFVQLKSNSSADIKRERTASAIREYNGNLETYKAQISSYVNCRQRADSRQDLRNAFFDNFDGLIALASQFRSTTIADQVKANKQKFDEKYGPLDSTACERPSPPQEPPNLPKGVTFSVPQIPAPYN